MRGYTNLNLTEWPGRDVFSDGLPVMGCIRAAEIIPMELKSKIEMLINFKFADAEQRR